MWKANTGLKTFESASLKGLVKKMGIYYFDKPVPFLGCVSYQLNGKDTFLLHPSAVAKVQDLIDRFAMLSRKRAIKAEEIRNKYRNLYENRKTA